MNENPNCQMCKLSAFAYSPCREGYGFLGNEAKIMILLPHPSAVEDLSEGKRESDSVKFLWWLLEKMSVPREAVLLDWTFKCYPTHKSHISRKEDRVDVTYACKDYHVATLQHPEFQSLKSLVALGSISAEAVLGRFQMGDIEGTHWEPANRPWRGRFEKVWVSYAPGYCLKKPAETVALYRVLFDAAVHAGLEPVFNPDLTMFDFDI